MLYWVRLDHEQSAAQCDSLASARSTEQRIRVAEPFWLVRHVSIYSEYEAWIHDAPLAVPDPDSAKV